MSREESAAPDMRHGAHRRWREMPAACGLPPIDLGLKDAVADFIARREAQLPDAWH